MWSSNQPRGISVGRKLTGIELDVVGDLARGNVHLHGVVGVDQGIRVADGTTVVCDQEWNTLGAQLSLLDLAQLVLQRGEKQKRTLVTDIQGSRLNL